VLILVILSIALINISKNKTVSKIKKNVEDFSGNIISTDLKNISPDLKNISPDLNNYTLVNNTDFNYKTAFTGEHSTMTDCHASAKDYLNKYKPILSENDLIGTEHNDGTKACQVYYKGNNTELMRGDTDTKTYIRKLDDEYWRNNYTYKTQKCAIEKVKLDLDEKYEDFLKTNSIGDNVSNDDFIESQCLEKAENQNKPIVGININYNSNDSGCYGIYAGFETDGTDQMSCMYGHEVLDSVVSKNEKVLSATVKTVLENNKLTDVNSDSNNIKASDFLKFMGKLDEEKQEEIDDLVKRNDIVGKEKEAKKLQLAIPKLNISTKNTKQNTITKTNAIQCDFEKPIFLSGNQIKNIYNNVKKHSELESIIDMFEKKGLVVLNTDGSIKYNSGFIENIDFNGINTFSCKLLQTHIMNETKTKNLSIWNRLKQVVNVSIAKTNLEIS